MQRLLVLTAILIGTAACSGGSASSETLADGDALESARHFEGYPIFWLGESHQGLPLTSIRLDVNFTHLTYGTCTPNDPDGRGPEGGSCPVPLSIQMKAGCGLLPPEMAVVEIEDFELRGVTAYRTGSVIEFATQNVLVKVYGNSDLDMAHVADSLQTLNDDVGPGDPLPTPGPGLPFDQQGQCGSLGNPTATPVLPK